MKETHLFKFNSHLKSVLLLLTLLFMAFLVHSCRKDNKSNVKLPEPLEAAKEWYESAYPAKAGGGKLQPQINGKIQDLSQWIKPDWLHNVHQAWKNGYRNADRPRFKIWLYIAA